MLSGPHLFNFLEIAAQLREAEGLAEVADGEALAEQLCQVLKNAARRQSMGKAGHSILKANQGALEQLLDGLECFLD
ncbi:3-deoxy-D-manno-octulosonic acid transferase [compost metagenome]